MKCLLSLLDDPQYFANEVDGPGVDCDDDKHGCEPQRRHAREALLHFKLEFKLELPQVFFRGKIVLLLESTGYELRFLVGERFAPKQLICLDRFHFQHLPSSIFYCFVLLFVKWNAEPSVVSSGGAATRDRYQGH